MPPEPIRKVAVSNWGNPSRAGTREIAEIDACLETRRKAANQQLVNAEVIQLLALTSGKRLLKTRSGSGLLCRMIAPALELTRTGNVFTIMII